MPSVLSDGGFFIIKRREKMSAREKAMEVRDMGCNCAQSVLLGCGEYTGLTETRH